MKSFVQLLGMFLFSFFAFCSSPKYTSPADFPDAQITFGSGGGITGFVTEYVLLENGQLFSKKTTDENYQVLTRVKKNEVKQIFKNYDFLKIGEIAHDHPSNMYQFIEFNHKDKKHRITWGDANTPVESNVNIFYGILNRLTKTEK